jgi:hypothetical protein
MGWSEKYKKSINCDNPKGFSQKAHCQGKKKKMNEENKKDHEYSMARSEVKTIQNAAKRLQKKMGKKGEGNLQAWVQSKITKAADYIDTAADYVTNEETKSGDSSLRDWFTKSRASDGTPGWVQLGGKYAGKPCARQPGQTTKPKCGSSKMKRNLDDEEEQRAFERKNRKDPNPDRKGKAKNVATEAVDATKYGGPDKLLQRLVPKGEKVIPSTPQKSANLEKAHFEPQGEVIGEEGKKDACYKKVKSRYSVWPSAYASGALVKCRKVGAANWGNKTKNENYDYSNWRDEFKALEIESIDIIKPEPLQATDGIGSRMLEEGKGKKCWKGYKKAGTQKLFGKTYNRCVKEGNKSFGQFMEDWQKVNKSDKTDGMSPAAVKAYRRENPGSKLKTAVTGDPKPGSKDAKRRKSFCSRSKGQQDMHNIDCSKDPDKAICKARRRWKC